MFLVDYPMQLLPNPHSTPVKRSSGTVFRQVHYLALICRSSQMFHFVVFINDESQNDFVLKDTSQPLNLTAKPKTPSPQALELAHLQTGYRPRDLPHSPPRSALSLSMWHYTTPTHPVSNITVCLKHWFDMLKDFVTIDLATTSQTAVLFRRSRLSFFFSYATSFTTYCLVFMLCCQTCQKISLPLYESDMSTVVFLLYSHGIVLKREVLEVHIQ